MGRSKWTTEQVEKILGEARDLSDWRGDAKSHMLAVLVDLGDWLLEESRAQRVGARERLSAALAEGGLTPEQLRYLTASAARGPADEDEDVEADLAASLAFVEMTRPAAGA